MPRALVAAVLLTLLLGACPEPEPDPYVQPGPWEALDFDQREEFMLRLFSPAMEELFLDEDPGLYAGFSCVTCHGDDPHYVMPADIEPLTLDDVPVDSIEDPDRREAAVWMEETILPAMADLLDQEISLAGASCTDCHPFE